MITAIEAHLKHQQSERDNVYQRRKDLQECVHLLQKLEIDPKTPTSTLLDRIDHQMNSLLFCYSASEFYFPGYLRDTLNEFAEFFAKIPKSFNEDCRAFQALKKLSKHIDEKSLTCDFIPSAMVARCQNLKKLIEGEDRRLSARFREDLIKKIDALEKYSTHHDQTIQLLAEDVIAVIYDIILSHSNNKEPYTWNECFTLTEAGELYKDKFKSLE